MFEIETKNLKIRDKLNRRIEMICRFAYVKPHILKVKGKGYLILEECEKVFINGYNDKIKLKDLENVVDYVKIYNMHKTI